MLLRVGNIVEVGNRRIPSSGLPFNWCVTRQEGYSMVRRKQEKRTKSLQFYETKTSVKRECRVQPASGPHQRF